MVRQGIGLLAAFGLALFLVADLALQLDPRWKYPVIGLYLIALAYVIGKKTRTAGARTRLVELQIGWMTSIGLLALALYLDGGLDGTFYPMIYVCFTLISVVFSLPAAIGTVGFSLASETTLRLIALHTANTTADTSANTTALVVHGILAVAFTLLGTLVLKSELKRMQAQSRHRVEAEIERIHSAARSYRLFATTSHVDENTDPGSDDSNENPERLARSSVEEIHEAVHYALDLLRGSLGLHTCMLLWLSDNGSHLRVSGLSSESQRVLDGPFAINEGLFGAISADETMVTLADVRPSYRLPYYHGDCPVQSVAAVAVVDDGQLRGVLVADRTSNEAFSQSDQDLLTAATRYMLRAIHNERVFVQLERAKVEQGKLYRAAKALGSATTERDVVEASVRSAREIASFDFAAVTLYDDKQKVHVIRAVSGSEQAHKLVGGKFEHNAGLVSMVVETQHPLPFRGQFDPSHQMVFSPQMTLPPMASLLVLPLIVHERPLGTLVLGSRRSEAFGSAVRPTLKVLASHVAVSLSGARMMKRLEELATRDGLTGLYNKRALLEMIDSKLASVKRFHNKLSVLIVDIDHFKKVNDTYGHDQGDIVIKGLASILKRAKRSTDAVARFGGEEFVVLCEQTETDGAMLLAERIRQELARQVFPTPQGNLSVTCSIGIATCPDAATDWDTLFKAADNALYVSKRSGRNRCTVANAKRSVGSAGSVNSVASASSARLTPHMPRAKPRVPSPVRISPLNA